MTAADGFEPLFGLADATSAAAAIRRGEVTPIGLVGAVLGGLAEANADVNAVVVTCPDRAYDEARRVDAARA
jgi:Asp-tRNA(Asn)/Glu-tRNA(Gln) amidotransferase A subunit family amidase